MQKPALQTSPKAGVSAASSNGTSPDGREPRPRTSPREDIVTGTLALFAVIGVYIDVYWHINAPERLETFFTPWHAMFYLGFLATATWMGWIVVRRRSAGELPLARAVPVGYGLGLLGVAIFFVGGSFDLVWHSLLGIEVGLEALISPPHLTLFLGGIVAASSPVRAAWRRSSRTRLGYREFAPQLLSLTVTTLIFALVFQTAAALHGWSPITSSSVLVAAPNYHTNDPTRVIGFLNILCATVLLLVPILLVQQRWHLPFGTCTTLFISVAAFQLALYRFDIWPVLFAALAGGLLADGLIVGLSPSPTRRWQLRLFATLAPAGLWSAYFVVFATSYELVWPPALVFGSIAGSGVVGFLLGLLAAPPASPILHVDLS